MYLNITFNLILFYNIIFQYLFNNGDLDSTSHCKIVSVTLLFGGKLNIVSILTEGDE